MCVCKYLSVCAWGGQTRTPYTLELELQEVVSRLMFVLGTELGSSAKAATALNAVISLAPISVPSSIHGTWDSEESNV